MWGRENQLNTETLSECLCSSNFHSRAFIPVNEGTWFGQLEPVHVCSCMHICEGIRCQQAEQLSGFAKEEVSRCFRKVRIQMSKDAMIGTQVAGLISRLVAYSIFFL